MPSYISNKHYKYLNYIFSACFLMGFYKFGLFFWTFTTFLLRESEFLSMLTDEEEYVFEDELDLPYFVFPDYNGSYTQYVKDTFDYAFFYLNETQQNLKNETSNEKVSTPAFNYRIELINYEGLTDSNLEIYSIFMDKFREHETKEYTTPLNTRSDWKNYTFLPQFDDEFDVFKQ